MSKAVVDEYGRSEPPLDADEPTTLLGFLDYLRATFAWKTSGLTDADFARTLAPSTMTLGGMLKHLAWVEDYWFVYVLAGQSPSERWIDVDWDADSDWDWNSAAEDSAQQLREMWQESCAKSREVTAELLPDAGTARIAARGLHHGERPNFRWILIHMIEEYARHVGHADLIRESIDGLVGE